jgi:hypothetical protein
MRDQGPQEVFGGSMTKAEEYKHPKWQAMRLKTLERFEFKCCVCNDTEKTLHVHHKRYPKGKRIWECAKDDLIVLCEDCHKETEDFVSFAREVGPYVHKCFRVSMGFCSPEDLLRMVTDYTAYQMDRNAGILFEVAIKAIQGAVTIIDATEAAEEE